MILKTKEASKYIGVSINTLKTLANNERIKSFKTSGGHRRFMQEDLDAFTGRIASKPDKSTVVYARCSTAKMGEANDYQKKKREEMRAMDKLCDKYLAKKFVEEKLEESIDCINMLREKEFLDGQHKLMLKSEKQEKSFWEYILQLIDIDCGRLSNDQAGRGEGSIE